MKKFSEVLATLESCAHLKGIQLFDASGMEVANIENIPGSQGSVKVYHHLLAQFGSINQEAAKAGLALYCEHTQDAELNAGKHPNIDRLFAIIASGQTLTAKPY